MEITSLQIGRFSSNYPHLTKTLELEYIFLTIYSKNSREYEKIKRLAFAHLSINEMEMRKPNLDYWVLQFEIQEDTLRKGIGNNILVWWGLGLDHLSWIITNARKVNTTKSLLERYNMPKIGVKGFGMPSATLIHFD